MVEVVGFDFGTTNSLIAFIADKRAIPLLEGGRPHPSVVCYQGNQRIVGRKAKDQLSHAGLGVMGNIVRSPKTLLGQEVVYVEGVARSPRDIVADIVTAVRDHAIGLHRESRYDQAVVTIPINVNGRWRAELRDAFRLAGIRIVQFVHEPFSALYGFLRSLPNFVDRVRELNRQYVLVFDWGGGTLDLTLCQVRDGTLMQIENDGTNKVGGDVLDETIRTYVIERVLAGRGITEEVPLQPGGREKLLALSEGAKIDLSNSDKALIFVTDFFRTQDTDVDLQYDLTRAELESVCERYVSEGIARIHRLLEKARIDPMSIAICLATGGMVNMPMIQSRLREIFGPQRLHVAERGATIIAEGAAWIAKDRRHLILAKNIELKVAVDSYFPLIKAGVQMPTEGEVQKETFQLYCTDPRDGIAKFQLASPKFIGKPIKSDPRDTLDNLTIKVHKGAKPLFERLSLDVTIDDNLILKASAFSAMQRDSDQVEIHDLAFGLSLPIKANKPSSYEDEPSEKHGYSVEREKGELTLRANITTGEDNKSLIPGELLYGLERNYFDTRLSPPQRQVDEYLYYQPCSICKRQINDPLCRCASGTT